MFFVFRCMLRRDYIPSRHPDWYSRSTSGKCFTTAHHQTFLIWWWQYVSKNRTGLSVELSSSSLYSSTSMASFVLSSDPLLELSFSYLSRNYSSSSIWYVDAMATTSTITSPMVSFVITSIYICLILFTNILYRCEWEKINIISTITYNINFINSDIYSPICFLSQIASIYHNISVIDKFCKESINLVKCHIKNVGNP